MLFIAVYTKYGKVTSLFAWRDMHVCVYIYIRYTYAYRPNKKLHAYTHMRVDMTQFMCTHTAKHIQYVYLIYICTHMSTNKHTLAYLVIRAYMETHINIYTYIFIRSYTCLCIYIYIYEHI